MSFDLGSKVKYVNKILGFDHEGPYLGVGIDEAAQTADAISQANAAINPVLRVQGMSCILIINNVAKQYWYRDNTTDLVEFTGGGGSSVNETVTIIDDSNSTVVPSGTNIINNIQYYNITSSHSVSLTNVTLNPPGVNRMKQFIKNVDESTFPLGFVFIPGQFEDFTSFSLEPGDAVLVQSDGIKWRLLSHYQKVPPTVSSGGASVYSTTITGAATPLNLINPFNSRFVIATITDSTGIQVTDLVIQPGTIRTIGNLVSGTTYYITVIGGGTLIVPPPTTGFPYTFDFNLA